MVQWICRSGQRHVWLLVVHGTAFHFAVVVYYNVVHLVYCPVLLFSWYDGQNRNLYWCPSFFHHRKYWTFKYHRNGMLYSLIFLVKFVINNVVYVMFLDLVGMGRWSIMDEYHKSLRSEPNYMRSINSRSNVVPWQHDSTSNLLFFIRHWFVRPFRFYTRYCNGISTNGSLHNCLRTATVVLRNWHTCWPSLCW